MDDVDSETGSRNAHKYANKLRAQADKDWGRYLFRVRPVELQYKKHTGTHLMMAVIDRLISLYKQFLIVQLDVGPT